MWTDVLAILLPRDNKGRIQLDRIPSRPRELPGCIVVRDTMCTAWYAALMDYPPFRAGLVELFLNWTDLGAEIFARRWLLGRMGLRDLWLSHRMWSDRPQKTPVLGVGSRMYGESEVIAHVPSGLANRELQQLGARRLLRARVLGWTWKQIATAEAMETGRVILDEVELERLSDTVRQDVYRWQRALGMSSRPRGSARHSKVA